MPPDGSFTVKAEKHESCIGSKTGSPVRMDPLRDKVPTQMRQLAILKRFGVLGSGDTGLPHGLAGVLTSFEVDLDLGRCLVELARRRSVLP